MLRANTETPLAARAGDILFSGDSLRAIGAPRKFSLLPGKDLSDARCRAAKFCSTPKQLKVKAGKLDAPKPVNACFLPQLVRVAVASQQHYGVSMTRGLAKPEGDVIAFDALPAAVQAELAPVEQRSAAEPGRRAGAGGGSRDLRSGQAGSQRPRRLPQSGAAVEGRRLGARPNFRTGRVAGQRRLP